MFLKQLPLVLRARHIWRGGNILFKRFPPPLRVRPPLDLFGEFVPPHSVTRGWIVNPRRSQFRFHLQPFFCTCRLPCLFFRRELARTNRVNNRSCSLSGDINPTALKSERV